MQSVFYRVAVTQFSPKEFAMRIKDAMKFLIENRTGTSTLNGSDAAWREHEDSLNFLADTTSGDVPIYIGGANFYLYSLSVPADVMQGDYVDDIGRWNFSPTSGYGYSCSWPDGKPKFQLEGPISQTGSKILDNGTAFFFLRQPWGRDGLNRLEINQQVCHILDLHWVAEKRSWCKLNNLGEVVPIARWEIKDSVNYVTMQRDELDDYLFLAKACLIRVFDVSRSRDFTLALGAGRRADPIFLRQVNREQCKSIS